ncbi:hypothetical protein E1B28_004057 [Marasmius oreades]|uniref:Transmembrane protein n=1 Tax=Marasmius oreades TaxID=181124 RepID=A0A9P8ABR3_9AGAR|nr:uncharacterized protein E1B28_004057 [Marasmius oreades]KAG7096641.1 hypothetical protein E1B28_004057 [Marasmius oreades]
MESESQPALTPSPPQATSESQPASTTGANNTQQIFLSTLTWRRSLAALFCSVSLWASYGSFVMATSIPQTSMKILYLILVLVPVAIMRSPPDELLIAADWLLGCVIHLALLDTRTTAAALMPETPHLPSSIPPWLVATFQLLSTVLTLILYPCMAVLLPGTAIPSMVIFIEGEFRWERMGLFGHVAMRLYNIVVNKSLGSNGHGESDHTMNLYLPFKILDRD